MSPTLKSIIGHKIKAIDLRPFDNGEGKLAYDPIITLDNGLTLHFVTQETQVGEYGVSIYVNDPIARLMTSLDKL